MDFLKDVNIQSHWDTCSENTKNAIWQYVQTLYMLGTTIKSIPAETLSVIENVAKECADKLGSGEGGDGNRGILNRRLLPLRGDDNFFDLSSACGLRRLRLRKTAECQRASKCSENAVADFTRNSED